MSNRGLLIIGCDATVQEAMDIASSDTHSPYNLIRTLQLRTQDYFPDDYSELYEYDPSEYLACVVGNEFYINQVRAEIYANVKAIGYRFTNIISKQSLISPHAKLGESNLIWPGVYIGANTKLGSGCVVRGSTQIYPDCNLGDFVTLEPHCVVREACSVENYSTLCASTYLMRASRISESVYINKPGQYFGLIDSGTFISPFFENSIKVIG